MNRITTVLLYNFGNPPLFCEIKQDVQSANCDTFLSDMVIYFETVILLSGDLLPEILYPYSKKVSSIHVMPSTWEKYEVLFTCPSYLSAVYLLYCMSFACISALLLHKNPSAQSWVNLPQRCSLCPHPCWTPSDLGSLLYKDIKKALKIFFGMADIKGPTAIELKKFPLLHLSQNLILFDQRVEVEISHSLYSWNSFFDYSNSS